MPARKKTLLDLVEDGTFLGRKDWALLDSDDEPPLPWKSVEKIRVSFREATNDFDRRRHRLEFEKEIPKLHARRERAGNTLEQAFEKLGPPRSAERLLNFFPAFLRWDDETPFKVDPYQRLVVEHGWRRDKHDRRIFKEIGTGIARGNGKTPFWSGIGLEELLAGIGKPKIFQSSGAKDQAKLGLGYLTDWIDESEQLRRWLRYSASSVNRRDGRGSYSVMAASGSLGHGRKPRIGLFDELWTVETAMQEKTVTALETAVFKQGAEFWAWISTAGYTKDSVLGRAFDSALKLPHLEHHQDGFHIRAWDEEAGRLFLWWGLPEGYPLDFENDKEMLKVIRLANPATWVDTYELLRAMKRALGKGEAELNEWIRFNLNGWVKTKAGWLPAGVWARLRSTAQFAQRVWEDDPEIPNGSTVFVAVDAARKRDTSSCGWACRLPDGRIAVRARVWSARSNIPHHVLVPGGTIRNSLVEDFIVNELGSRYRVAEVVYDPRFFDTQGENLSDAGFMVAPFEQNSGAMADAWQHMYEATLEGTVTHNGDPVIAAQAEAVAAVLTENGWKVFKLKSSEPFDSFTAMTMARERCALETKDARKRQSVYNRRPVRVIDIDGQDDVDDDELEDEGALIRAAAAAARVELAGRLVGRLVKLAEPVEWGELTELEADAVAGALQAAAAAYMVDGQSVRSLLCLEELRRRPIGADG